MAPDYKPAILLLALALLLLALAAPHPPAPRGRRDEEEQEAQGAALGLNDLSGIVNPDAVQTANLAALWH